jgi:hypothetical protein
MQIFGPAQCVKIHRDAPHNLFFKVSYAELAFGTATFATMTGIQACLENTIGPSSTTRGLLAELPSLIRLRKLKTAGFATSARRSLSPKRETP